MNVEEQFLKFVLTIGFGVPNIECLTKYDMVLALESNITIQNTHYIRSLPHIRP